MFEFFQAYRGRYRRRAARTVWVFRDAIVALVVLGTCARDDTRRETGAGLTDPVPDNLKLDPPQMTPEGDAEAVYRRIKARFEHEPQLPRSDAFAAIAADLRRLANGADDRHLRANAALLLGALHESRGEWPVAIGLYRHASRLVNDDPGPLTALALALASREQFGEAATVQAQLVALDPDNLESWLVLGELRHRADDPPGAAAAYVGYERRRKGIIDGLTLGHDGVYRLSPQERAACALALAPASDQGTAVALVYSLKSDPDPIVRATVAEVMGAQRLALYRSALVAQRLSATDTRVQEAVAYALAAIARNPIEPHKPTEKRSPPVEAPSGDRGLTR